MAQIEIHSQGFGIGAYTGATDLPFVNFDPLAGGVTFTKISIHGNGAGTAIGLKLITLSETADGGTPVVDGTIAAWAGTIVYAAGVVHEATISTAYWGGTGWLGVQQTSGTAPTVTAVSYTYQMGK